TALPRLLVPHDGGGFAAQILCVGHPELDDEMRTSDCARIRLPHHVSLGPAEARVTTRELPERQPEPGTRRRVCRRVAGPLGVAATAIFAVAVARHNPRDRPPDAIADAAGIRGRATSERAQPPSAEETL